MIDHPNIRPSDHPTIRVAIWCAVSSKDQAAEDKISLHAQEEAGRQFAAAIDGAVVRVYTVPGHTRDIVFWQDAERTMPAYKQLRLDVLDRAFDVLHAIDPDRLGRDPALSNQVLSLVEKSGAEVYLATNPHIIGRKGTGHRYVFAIQSTRAGEDQRRRVQYHDRGMRNRIQRGLHAGTWPTGYTPIHDPSGRTVGAQLDQDAPAIRLITEFFLQGVPYLQIACQMDDTPYPPPKSERWGFTTIIRILHNDTYAGLVTWDGTTAPSNRFPAIWDDATHAAVQRERARRKGNKSRRSSSPLLHVVWCAECGHPMHRCTIHRRDSEYTYQRCTAHRRDLAPHHVNYVREETIIAALTQYLETTLTDAIIQREIARLGTDNNLEKRLEEITYEENHITEQRTRLALALASGTVDTTIYRRADDRLIQQHHALAAERASIQQQLNALPNPDALHQSLTRLRDTIPTLFTLPPHRTNTLLRNPGIHIWCHSGQITKITIDPT